MATAGFGLSPRGSTIESTVSRWTHEDGSVSFYHVECAQLIGTYLEGEMVSLPASDLAALVCKRIGCGLPLGNSLSFERCSNCSHPENSHALSANWRVHCRETNPKPCACQVFANDEIYAAPRKRSRNRHM
jgi:hypothetical protein